jgi:hypothetical protein
LTNCRAEKENDKSKINAPWSMGSWVPKSSSVV